MNLEEEFANLVENNTLEKVKENIYLTKYQQKVLEDYHISFTSCKDMSELLFLLSDITDSSEFDSLEEVARQIEEFYYYNDTNK